MQRSQNGAGGSSTGPGQAHPLQLKVMRLSVPTFLPSNTLYFEHRHANSVSHALESLALADPIVLRNPPSNPHPGPPLSPSRNHRDSLFDPSATADVPPLLLRDLGISSLLSLPTSFGTIYLGETFSSYISINNESSGNVPEVAIKAEMQTKEHRFTLVDTTGGLAVPPGAASGMSTVSLPPMQTPTTSPGASTSGPTDLPAHQTSEHIVHHEIKELGTHILVCSVHYLAPGSTDRRFFRKFYKFEVANPLAVRTKVNSLPDGRVFLEAQVQNAAASPMFLERLRFEPNPVFEYRDLNYVWVDSETGAATGVSYAARSADGPPPPLTPISQGKTPGGPDGIAGNPTLALLDGTGSPVAVTDRRPDPADPPPVVAGASSAGGIADQILRHRAIALGETLPSTHVESVFGPANLLNPQDVRQYLYLLSPRDGSPSAAASLTAATLGKLDIQWRTAMGEVGRLQTSQLGRKVPPLEPLEVLVVSLHPGPVVPVELPLRVHLLVRNNSAEPMRVVVQAASRKLMGSVLLRGPSTYGVGEVPAGGGTKEVTLEFVPVVAGLHRVGGFRVADQISGLYKDVDGVCEVLVVDAEEGEVEVEDFERTPDARAAVAAVSLLK